MSDGIPALPSSEEELEGWGAGPLVILVLEVRGAEDFVKRLVQLPNGGDYQILPDSKNLPISPNLSASRHVWGT